MISYSARAARALGFLKRSVNDIEIYVEDTANHAMWLKIIQRVIPPHKKIRSVTQLGGKRAVLSACSLDQRRRKARRLYIIDGDYDVFNGNSPPDLKYLYRIDSYCIENVLVSEEALADLCLSLKPNLKVDAILSALAFERWMQSTVGRLHSLFALYALAFTRAPSLSTIGQPVSSLYNNNRRTVEIDKTLALQRMIALSKLIRTEIGRDEFRREMRHVRARLKITQAEKVVSGKDYILPMLYIHMRKLFGYKQTLETFKVQLAERWNPAKEPSLASAIRSLF